MTSDAGNSTVDLDRVVALLREMGMEAEVEQTGGGTATVYAGPVVREEADWGPVRAACAGPGWFEGPGWTNARAEAEALCIGVDDPYGESELHEYAPAGVTEEEVAEAIAAYARLAVAAAGA